MTWHRQKLSSWTGFTELVERLNLNEQETQVGSFVAKPMNHGCYSLPWCVILVRSLLVVLSELSLVLLEGFCRSITCTPIPMESIDPNGTAESHGGYSCSTIRAQHDYLTGPFPRMWLFISRSISVQKEMVPFGFSLQQLFRQLRIIAMESYSFRRMISLNRTTLKLSTR